MHSKRNPILIGAGAGIASAFLPWIKLGMLSVAGTDGPDGLIVIGVFAVTLVIALSGDKSIPLVTGARTGAAITGLIGTAIAIWKFIGVSNAGIGRFSPQPGAGLYVMMIAGVVVFIGALSKEAPAASRKSVVPVVTEMPSPTAAQSNVGGSAESSARSGAVRWRWFAGIISISVAAAVTFLIIRSTRDPAPSSAGSSAPSTGRVHIDSVPAGAEVTFDGARLTEKTPVTIEGVPVGSRHEVKVELARHKVYSDSEVDVPKKGGEVQVMARLQPGTGN